MLDKSMPSQRILLLILLPPLIIGLLLGIHFLWSQSTQRQAGLLEHGRLLGEQLAFLSAPALAGSDHHYLQRLARESIEHQQLRSVRLLDTHGTVLASAGPRPQAPEPQLDSEHDSYSGTSEQSRFRYPVYSSHQLMVEVPADGQRQLLGWVDLELTHQATQLGLYRDLLVLAVLCLFGLSLLIPLVYRLFDALRRPLFDLATGLARLRDNQLHARLPAETGNTELDAIARDFNDLAERLQKALDDLQSGADLATADMRQSMETLERQNIELGMELSVLRKAAREGSRSQNTFLANMGHEIRTPLNAVLGFIRLLHKTRLDAHQRDCVNHIDESAHNLLTLVNNILDLSKMEAGKLKLLPAPLNLRDLIDDTLAMYAPQAHDSKLELVSLYYQDTPHSVIGDAQRLRQIIGNLLSNAIKFTSSGQIIVRTELEDQYDDRVFLRIRVQDSGIGIHAQDVPNLFKVFSQLDDSSTRQTSGSGLGLAICRNLVQQMGGEIGVNSEPGNGSEFWFTLQLRLSGEQDGPPPAILAGQRVALLARRECTQFQLRGLLDELQLTVHLTRNLENLVSLIESDPQLRLAVIDTEFAPPDETLSNALDRLCALDCRVLLLCPANQTRRFQSKLREGCGLVLNRPVSPQRLASHLCELLDADLPQVELLPAPPQPGQQRQPYILCVDDNPSNLLLLRTLLEEMGARTLAVDSGLAAVEACSRECFDLVFMDVQMPEMDGRQATEAIRRNEHRHRNCPAVPIVALTAHALEDERRALLQGGMDDYLNKPATPQQLQQVIRKWVDLQQPGCPPGENCENCGPVHFDPNESLRLSAGNHQLACELLQMLLESLPTDWALVREYRQSGERERLIEQVHRIHGATRYCGVPQLRLACQQAETLLKQQQPAEQALDALDAAIKALLELQPQMPVMEHSA